MPDESTPNAREQRIVDLRDKIQGGISPANIGPILEEITVILQEMQSEDDRLQREKMNKGEGVNGGGY